MIVAWRRSDSRVFSVGWRSRYGGCLAFRHIGRRQGCDRLEQSLTVTQRGDTNVFQVSVGQLRENIEADGVIGKGLGVLGKALVSQSTMNVTRV